MLRSQPYHRQTCLKMTGLFGGVSTLTESVLFLGVPSGEPTLSYSYQTPFTRLFSLRGGGLMRVARALNEVVESDWLLAVSEMTFEVN